MSWIRWRLAPTWRHLRGEATCADVLGPQGLTRVREALRSDEKLRRPLTNLIWRLSPELRGILLVGFEAKLRAGKPPALAAVAALSSRGRELRSSEARVCERLLRGEALC